MSDAGQVGFKQPQAGGPSAGDAGAGFYNSLSVSLRFWPAAIKYREGLEKQDGLSWTRTGCRDCSVVGWLPLSNFH
jgi:hypothetical protein